jgi:hypothetical protein
MRQRHNRILPLAELAAYPGATSMDSTFWLPAAEDARRRVWMMVPDGSPEVRIEDTVLQPENVVNGALRWIDYGVAEVPTGFTQLRVQGIGAEQCRRSFLLISADLMQNFGDCSIVDAERRLWGLARRDAGSTTLQPSVLAVGSEADFVVRYTAGPRGLPAGAQVRFTVPMAFARPQNYVPERPGYVSVLRTDRRVKIEEIGDSVESHEKIDIICRLGEDLGTGQGFELSYRTDWTYIFPCRFRGTERRFWYSKLPPLAAAVAISEEHDFVSPLPTNGHAFELVPGPAERIHLFLPGRRRTDERLTLRGIVTDRYRNVPPEGPMDLDFRIDLESRESRYELGSPAGYYTAKDRFRIPLPDLPPGVYRAVALPRGSTRVMARSNPMEILPVESDRNCLYWGEIHGHTEMSDGSGEFGDLYRHAREVGCLDFAAAADHACYFSDNEWLWMQDVTNSWNAPGRFVTLVGYEWAGKQVHRNVYTSRPRLRLFRGMYEPESSIDTVWAHFHGDEKVVGGPHAPQAHGLIWEHHDPAVERFVEIYSMWGASDRPESPLAPEWAQDKESATSANELLQSGARLGFTAGGDCHEGRVGFTCEDPQGQGGTPHTFAERLRYRCGLTAAALPRLARNELLRALRNRRTYATTGARILLDFSAAGVPMGGEGQSSKVVCLAKVHSVAPLDGLEIVRNGEVAFSRKFQGRDVELRWEDPQRPVGEVYYYLHVVQQDEQEAWSSPVWIRRA